jgi:hypothetical protein
MSCEVPVMHRVNRTKFSNIIILDEVQTCHKVKAVITAPFFLYKNGSNCYAIKNMAALDPPLIMSKTVQNTVLQYCN